MKNLKLITLSIIALLFIASCGSQKKCNGKRGTRVEMGTM
jgi:hypothetical protein